jgi:hypothetical protein
MTPAFRDRLRAMPPEQLPPYQYRDPRVDDVAPDGDGARVKGRVFATTRVTRKPRPDGLIETSGYGTAGDVDFEMALRLGNGSGGWLVDDFRFLPRTRRVSIDRVSDDDWEDFLGGIPEPLRRGKTWPGLASELGAKGWALAFRGGPVRWRCRVSETGQETVGKESDLLEPTGLNGHILNSKPLREEGRFVFGFRRWGSERMAAIAKKAGRDADPNGVMIRVAGGGFNGSVSRPDPFLWFHWHNEGRGWTAEQSSSVAFSEPLDKPVALLEYTVTETNVPAGTTPRVVKLTFSAEPVGE